MRISLCSFCLFFFLALPPSPLASSPEKGVDAVLVIDSSGSMKNTDPGNLRKAAAKMFISLLGKEDKVGIVEFDREGRLLSRLIAAEEGKTRKDLFRAIGSITSAGLFTHIHDGIRKGFDLLATSSAADKVLILLSDGKMDLGDRTKEEFLTAQMTDSLFPALKAARIKVYTIAFTANSDRRLLEQIAEKTGGFFSLASTGNDLHIVFAKLFSMIKSPDTLPLQGEGFYVDKDVRELTLLATKKSAGATISLRDPSSRELTSATPSPGITWFGSTAFMMVTVKNPAAGRWKVTLSSDEGNKVFIVTDLKLCSSLDKTYVPPGANLKVDVWLQKDKEVIRSKEVFAHLKLSARVRTPGGSIIELPLRGAAEGSTSPPDGGVYSAQYFPDRYGDYSVTLRAEAPTFTREKEFSFIVGKDSHGKALPSARSDVPGNKDHGEPLSWAAVFVKLFMINTAAAAVIASGFYARGLREKIRRQKR